MGSEEFTRHPDIQGLLFRGYANLYHAGYGFFRIVDRTACKFWLTGLLDSERISTAKDGPPELGTQRLNIAFAASGLEALLGAGWIPDSYEPPFVEGMVTAHRCRLLGDVEDNDPEHWRWGKEQDFDGLFMAFGNSGDEAEQLLADHLCSDNGVVRVQTVYGHLNGHEKDGEREAFGFRDGISQPIIEGTSRYRDLPKEAALHGVPAGEMILGYPDGTGKLPRTPAVSAASDPRGWLKPHWEWPERRDLGMNGSYLVFRQLAQDTEGFWRYVNEAAAGGQETPLELAEKMVGRRKDGTSMEKYPKSDKENNNLFNFAKDDAQGKFCPVGSHIRRSNPRATGSKTEKASLKVTLRHRILRRGRVYEDAELGEVGLQFICFNASIARQFEFIQGSWCNNQFFDGLQREVDPIIGTVRKPGNGLDAVDRFTIPRDPYRRRLDGIPTFVTMKGGGYFFMPGMAALRCIATAP